MTKSDRIINSLARELAEKADRLQTVIDERDQLINKLQVVSFSLKTVSAELRTVVSREKMTLGAVKLASASCTRKQREAIRIALGVK